MSIKMDKVLVAAPTYNCMKYCDEEFFNAIKGFTYGNYDILIVENSQKGDYFDELKKYGVKIIRDETNEKDNLLRLVSSRNKIIKYALENDYDYILMMDSDVIPPEDIIERLLAHKKDIVSGLYFNLMMSSGKLQLLPVAWKQITKEEFEEIRKILSFPVVVMSHEDLRRHLIPEEFNSNKLLEVLYPSAGCMLIKKNVFENIKYGLLNTGELRSSDDIYFINKAREFGFKVYCDTSIKCFHCVLGKYKSGKNGEFIHPFYSNDEDNKCNLQNKNLKYDYIK